MHSFGKDGGKYFCDDGKVLFEVKMESLLLRIVEIICYDVIYK